MRLTNVAHLRLPFGRLLGYDLALGETTAELPVSYDQARHVGAGDRPGSWMALSIKLDDSIAFATVERAWLAVIERHGTLRSVFTPGDSGPRLHEVEVVGGDWVEHPIGTGQAVNEALRDVLDTHCRPYGAPSHRLCLLETADGTTVVIAADHSHVDMWSMLVIARDLMAAIEALGTHDTVDLGTAPSFSAHTAALRDRPPAPDGVRRRWRELLADGGMPRFPMPLGEVGGRVRERVEVRDVLDVDATAALGVGARERGVSTLSLVVAAMTEVTDELAATPLRAVFPVHSRYDETWHDSVGWFITNSVLESTDADPAACAVAVKEAVELGSWPLADLVGSNAVEVPGMFAISWLDLRRLPVRVDSVGLEAQYVGAEVLTDGVMLWFVLDESGLHLRCRYPDTREARRNVGGWLDQLIATLRSIAREAAGVWLDLDERTYRIERAERDDVPEVVALLADDPIGRMREHADQIAAYERAFDAIARDPTQYLAAVRNEQGRLVGTMQLTIVPGLSRGGATRLTVEAVRVVAEERGRGLGSAMLEWAHDHGRARGATVAQLSTDIARSRAHAFYERAGYASTHVGFKRKL